MEGAVTKGPAQMPSTLFQLGVLREAAWESSRLPWAWRAKESEDGEARGPRPRDRKVERNSVWPEYGGRGGYKARASGTLQMRSSQTPEASGPHLRGTPASQSPVSAGGLSHCPFAADKLADFSLCPHGMWQLKA